MTLLITHCTKRKRAPVPMLLHARLLTAGTTAEVAADWVQRLRVASPTIPAKDLYAGRGLSEVRRAAEQMGGRLAVISAGLGLIDGETRVPAYGLTTIGGDPDDVRLKTGANRSEWWGAIQAVSPFVAASPAQYDGLILAAVSSAYLEMVAADWSAWCPEDLARLRLFSKSPPSGPAAALRPAWMPYDDRLDQAGSGLAGTQGDFAQRALRHFATRISSTTQREDAIAVETALAGLRLRSRPLRQRLDDAALKAAIRKEWAVANGQSSTMLRRLRDALGLACEQGRFRSLFNEVKAEIKL